MLCIASSTEYEHRRTPENRLKLVGLMLSGSGDYSWEEGGLVFRAVVCGD